MSETTTYWYAVYTLPRWEKKLARKLEDLGYEVFCPLNRVKKQWSDRKKTVLEPLFKGYLFLRLEEARKWDIKNVQGIINFVYWNGKPGIIRNEEIETIKRFLNQFTDVEVTDYKLTPEARVRIKAGILMNYEGTVIELQGNRAVVKIESMGIQLSALFEKKNLEPI